MTNRARLAARLVWAERFLPVLRDQDLQDARAGLPLALPGLHRCPACEGARLQPEARCWKWRGRTLPQLYQRPVTELLTLIEGESAPSDSSARPDAHSADLAHDSIVTRLRYLQQVGLGYLTLDRASRTLSGGESSASISPRAWAPRWSTPSLCSTNRVSGSTRGTSTG